MQLSGLLACARQAAGLTQSEVARRAGTSRTTLSAYEHGRKSPTLQTAARVLAVSGFALVTTQQVAFSDVPAGRGRTVFVPNVLPRLPLAQAMARVVLPLHLNWSGPGEVVNLSVRRERARAYEVVLREGRAEDITQYVDGALLLDLWEELVLPRAVRAAWQSVVAASLPATL